MRELGSTKTGGGESFRRFCFGAGRFNREDSEKEHRVHRGERTEFTAEVAEGHGGNGEFGDESRTAEIGRTNDAPSEKGKEYNCGWLAGLGTGRGYGQQTDSEDFARDGFPVAD